MGRRNGSQGLVTSVVVGLSDMAATRYIGS
jgi:hypothetical protein